MRLQILQRAASAGSSRRSQVAVRAVPKEDARADKKNNDLLVKGAKTLAAVALCATLTVGNVEEAQAKKDISGLTPCAKSKPYAKREKQAIKALQKRLKKYEAGSAGASALNDQIAKTFPGVRRWMDNMMRQPWHDTVLANIKKTVQKGPAKPFQDLQQHPYEFR